MSNVAIDANGEYYPPNSNLPLWFSYDDEIEVDNEY